MLRKIMAGAVLALAATSGVIVAAPAQANPSTATGGDGIAAARYISLGENDLCPLGYFCAFDQVNLVGRGVGFFNTELNWGTIPSQFRWINNHSPSGTNNGEDGSLPDVLAYPHPNHAGDPHIPTVCLGNGLSPANPDWSPLRPESNKWVSNRC